MINLVQKIISAAANQLSCANRVRYIKAYTRKWKKKRDVPQPHRYYCIYWAWRSWTVSWSAQGMRRIIVLTVFCPKQLHVSQYNTLWWHIVTPLTPDQGLDKLPTTQSVWLEHTRRSQVQAWPSFVWSAISIGSVFWHLSSSAQLHSSVQTRLFRLQEHLHEHLLVDSTLLDPHTCIEWVEEPASWACTYW